MTTQKEKENYVENFIKSFAAVEHEMQPYKEHKRDLRKEYADNGWLTREEMRLAIRAYRMLKTDEDLTKFNEIFKHVSKSVGG